LAVLPGEGVGVKNTGKNLRDGFFNLDLQPGKDLQLLIIKFISGILLQPLFKI
jgi:hypothetical protein